MRDAASRIAPLAAAAALLAACGTREIHATPFAIAVTDRFNVPLLGSDPLLVQGQVLTLATDGSSIVVDDPNLGGAISIAFASARTGIAFPAQLQGATVVVQIAVSATARAPDGTPLPHPALSVFQEDAPAGASYQFFLGEGDLEQPSGLPQVPPLLSPGDPDVPSFDVFTDNTQFEPSSCGLFYYDLLRVEGDSTIALRRDEGGTVQVDQRVGGVGRPVWHVQHELSFHRIDCSSRPRAWTQLAAWRQPDGK